MAKKGVCLIAFVVAIFSSACPRAVAPDKEPWDLHKMVAPVQRSVVIVAAMGTEGDVLRIGSGFFIDRDGTLVTSDHVLEGAFEAKVKTADVGIFPISAVIAYSPLVDLMKVRVQIPPGQAVPLYRGLSVSNRSYCGREGCGRASFRNDLSGQHRQDPGGGAQ